MDIKFGPGFYKRDRYQSIPRACLNMFAEAAPNQDDREFVLYPTPGLNAYKDLSGTLTRGLATSYDQFNNDLFVVYDNQFKRVTTAGVVGSNITIDFPVGEAGNSIENDSKPVSFAFSPKTAVSGSVSSEMAITSGGEIYVYLDDGSDPSTAKLYHLETHDTDIDNLFFVGVVYLAGRFVFIPNNEDKFWWSDTLDGTAIDALAFATTERKGSNLRCGVEFGGDLWLFERDNIEIWSPTGRSDLPFQLRPGGIIDKGIIGSYAFCRVGQSLFWMGEDRVIYRAEGQGATPVSTPAISELIQGLSDSAGNDVTAFSYTDDGHQFVVFNVPLVGGLVYDTTTGEWHQRISNATLVGLGSAPGYVPWVHVWWRGSHHVGSRYDAGIYTFDKSLYNEESVDGNTSYEVSRETTMFVPVRRNTPCYNFTVDCAKGVGNANDTNPQVTVSWSDDQGQTYNAGRALSLGTASDYDVRVITRGLGQMKAPGRVFKLSYTDKALYALYGARVNEANP